MGVVYRARHVLIDRVVALKLIRPDLRGETHLRAWMLREARAANRVDHAHIIDIHDIGETEEGELYLVMEYLVGTPLSASSPRGRCPRRARRHPRADVRRPRPRPRPRRRPPRPQERQHPAHHPRRPEGLRQDPRLRPRRHRARSAPRAEGRGVRHARVHVAGAGPRRGGRGPVGPLRPRRPLLRDAHGAAPLPLERPRDAPRDAALARRPAPALIKPRRRTRRPRSICLRLLEKDPQALPRRPPPPGRAEGPAAQPALAGLGGRGGDGVPPPRRRRRPQSAGVTEWASRAALFARMVARAYPAGNAPPEVAQAAHAVLGPGRPRQPPRGRGREPHAQARGSSAAAAPSAPRSAARSRSSPTRSPASCARPPPTARTSRRSAPSCSRPSARGRRAPARGRRAAPGRRRPSIFERAGAAAGDRAGQARAARPLRASRRTRARAHRPRSSPPDRGAAQPARPLRRGARGGSRRRAARRSPSAHARGARVREGVQRRLEHCSSATSATSPSAATSSTTCCKPSAWPPAPAARTRASSPADRGRREAAGRRREVREEMPEGRGRGREARGPGVCPPLASGRPPTAGQWSMLLPLATSSNTPRFLASASTRSAVR
jgi:hypothetical protein